MKEKAHILVIFHVYYKEQLPWFLSKMANICHCDWDLLVTGADLDKTTRETILRFKNDSRFLETDNAGYDVWPFIQAIQQTDLTPYDFILKLHTKGLSKGENFHYKEYHFTTKKWRDGLVDALLANQQRWIQVLNVFQKKEDVGMVCSRKFLILSKKMPEDTILLEDEKQRLGIVCTDHRFCAGTMFAIRPSVLQPILSRNLTKEDFIAKQKSHSSGTLAHVYERIFCILVKNAGLKIHPIGETLSVFLSRNYYKFIIPVLSWFFEINRDYTVSTEGQKYLRILGMRFNLK